MSCHGLLLCAWLLSWATTCSTAPNNFQAAPLLTSCPSSPFFLGAAWRVAVATSFNDSTPAFTSAPSTPPTYVKEYAMRYYGMGASVNKRQCTPSQYCALPDQHIQLRPRVWRCSLTRIHMTF
ncbi:hypothetical protein ABBQ38_005155 [Trebouxia sp. C0009 RCD-2024]